MPSTPVLRGVRPGDLPQLLEIYNHYVVSSTVTFDEEPLTLDAFGEKAERVQRAGLPFIVAEGDGPYLTGFAYAAQWRPKSAYRQTAETSIYLHPDATGRGVGSALLGELVGRCAAFGVRQLIAVIVDDGGEASVRLHRAFGFEQVGHLRAVGRKFGRPLGTILMQKTLPGNATAG